MIPDSSSHENPRRDYCPPIAELSAELDALDARLAEGERRIEEATRVEADTDTWEEFWIELLHSYDAIYRRLAEIDTDGGA